MSLFILFLSTVPLVYSFFSSSPLNFYSQSTIFLPDFSWFRLSPLLLLLLFLFFWSFWSQFSQICNRWTSWWWRQRFLLESCSTCKIFPIILFFFLFLPLFTFLYLSVPLSHSLCLSLPLCRSMFFFSYNSSYLISLPSLIIHLILSLYLLL